jgi:hypothetical protein
MALAVTQHRRPGRQHAADGFHGFLGLALLDQAQDRVDHDYREDHRGIDPVPQHDRNHGGSEQYIDQDVVKLREEARREPPARRLREAVRATLLQPAGRLDLGQSGRLCFQTRQNVPDGFRVGPDARFGLIVPAGHFASSWQMFGSFASGDHTRAWGCRVFSGPPL